MEASPLGEIIKALTTLHQVLFDLHNEQQKLSEALVQGQAESQRAFQKQSLAVSPATHDAHQDGLHGRSGGLPGALRACYLGMARRGVAAAITDTAGVFQS